MRKILAVTAAAVLAGAFAAAPLWATNGMDMIGYSTRASSMGGADVAVDGDANSVSGNPAVVSGATPSSATLGLSVLMPHMNMQNTFMTMQGPVMNDVDSDDQYFVMPLLGYVHKFQGAPLSVGFGFFAQGGMGVDFHDVQTFAGTKDELTSQVSFARLNPLIAYQPAPWVSLGATVMIGYSQMKFSFFPDTYSPGMDGTPGTGDDFAGMDVKDLASFAYAGRVGAQFKAGSQLRFGVMYTSEATIDLDGGDAELNFGQMKVGYDAEMKDFTWPQEVEAGIAYIPVKGLTIAADVKWINWSATIEKPVLRISDPDQPVPMTERDIEFDMNWDDQWVYAIGLEYAINPMHTVRAGFNYGKSPVPDDHLNPLFPAIVEKHLTLGYGLNLGNWSIDLGYEHAFEKTQSNTNTNQMVNPFGPDLEVSHSQDTVHAGVTYRY